ncbi:MAG: cysteine desulfurase family protein [Planctomycetota bacterium]
MRQIYLDYNSTTPVAPEVVEAMTPFLAEHFGNPSSSHSRGRAASEAIVDARSKVAGLIACDPREIVFTGCGSESNNLAIKGVLMRHLPEGSAHLVISAIEHAAVSKPAAFLKRLGVDVTVVGTDSNGVVSPAEVEKALRTDTRLVSIMHSNNEIGTIQPIREIAEICHRKGVLVHTDASQSTGKLPLMVDLLEVDMMTLAGHKFYATKGIGVLFVRDGLELEPLIHGADHENGMRAGTEATAAIVGIGAAAHLAYGHLDENVERMTGLRDRLQEALSEGVDDLIVNAADAKRLPNTLSVAFPGVSGYELLSRAPEVLASTGPACHSAGDFESPTLKAIGLSPDRARGVVRLSLGAHTTAEEVDSAAELLVSAWEAMNL